MTSAQFMRDIRKLGCTILAQSLNSQEFSWSCTCLVLHTSQHNDSSKSTNEFQTSPNAMNKLPDLPTHFEMSFEDV